MRQFILESAFLTLIMTISHGCCKNCITQMSHNNIKKSLDYSDKFHFDSFNIPSTYTLNMDSITAMKKRGLSFCKLIKRDLGYIQTFYATQFDFDTDQPLKQKSSFCNLDNCKSTDHDCRFSITFLSKFFTIDKQALKAKSLPKLLFMSDKFYDTQSYYGVMLRIDINVATTTIKDVSLSELDISTEIIWRQRSCDDTEGWEKMNRSEQINDIQFEKFKTEYQKQLTKYLDGILANKGYLTKSKTK